MNHLMDEYLNEEHRKDLAHDIQQIRLEQEVMGIKIFSQIHLLVP